MYAPRVRADFSSGVAILKTMKGRIEAMGTYAKEPRNRMIVCRLTEKEYILLKKRMADLFYLSKSKYLRDCALDQRVTIRRNVVLTDNQLRRQINELTAQIAAIGVDYNQATKKFNSLMSMTRPDGSPVLNARAANTYLNRVFALTTEVKRMMEDVIDTVENMNLPQGQDDNQ